jgi:hypothetical protein
MPSPGHAGTGFPTGSTCGYLLLALVHGSATIEVMTMSGTSSMFTGRGGPGGNWKRLHKNAVEVSRTYEARLRRMAERQGFRLEKSKLRDASAKGFGTFQLVNTVTGEKITGRNTGPAGKFYTDIDGNYGLILDRVHRILVSRGGKDLWHGPLEPMSAEELARYTQDD